MTGELPAIIDPSSGLFTEAFLRATLPTRVATARRAMKQLGLVVLQVIAPPDEDAPGEPAPAGPTGAVIRDTLRDSDTGVLLDDGRFALLLEFTPVDGCVIIATRLGDRLRAAEPGTGVYAGVASYPVHAIDAAELLQTSDRALQEAIDAGPGTVAIAPIAD